MKEKIKEEKIRELLKILNQYDFSLGLLKIIYQEREGFTVNSMNDNLGVGYQKIHRFLSRLNSLGFLRGDGSLKLSQIGLEVFKKCIKLDIGRDFIEVMAGKHNHEVLGYLREKRSWKEIKSEIKLASSSIKNILDFLVKENLVDKSNGKYITTREGKELLEKYEDLLDTPILPKYEIQVKFREVKSIPKKIKEKYNLNLKEEVEQEDRYYKEEYSQKFSENYLRLRIERSQTSSLKKSPSHEISWANTIDSRRVGDIKILEREKETLNTKYPEILFFLNYFDATEEVKVIKKRKVYKNKQGLIINLDEICEPVDENYVEMKFIVRERDKIEGMVNRIKELIAEMGLKDDQLEEKTYVEIFDKYEE